MSLSKRTMLEDELEDTVIRDLAQKLKVMSLSAAPGDTLARDFQNLGLVPAQHQVETAKEIKQKRHECYIIATNLELRRVAIGYDSAALEQIARLARTKR